MQNDLHTPIRSHSPGFSKLAVAFLLCLIPCVTSIAQTSDQVSERVKRQIAAVSRKKLPARQCSRRSIRNYLMGPSSAAMVSSTKISQTALFPRISERRASDSGYLCLFGCVMVIAIASTFGGRLFCGWVCPHNTMTEWTSRFENGLASGKNRFAKATGGPVAMDARRHYCGKPAVGAGNHVFNQHAVLFYFVPVPWVIHNLQAGTLPGLSGAARR